MRLAFFLDLAQSALPDLTTSFVSADMNTYWKWSGTIRDGDWLGRAVPRTYAAWMERCGSPETWDGYWGGRGVLPQVPLYPLLLAALRALGSDAVRRVLLLQLLLGAAKAPLVALLARAAFGAAAGLWAGVLAALFLPFVLYDGVVLRDGWPVVLEAAVMLALLHAAAPRPPPSPAPRPPPSAGRWLAAGVLLGLALLTKETVLLFIPGALLWAAGARGVPAPRTARAALLVGAGLALVVAPLVARNLAVGAPPLAFSNRGPETFVEAHSRGTSTSGAFDAPALCDVLAGAQGSLWRAALLTLATWRDDPAGLVWHEGRRLAAALSPGEIADNVDEESVARVAPILRLLPGFGWVLPLALAGLFAVPRADGDPSARRLLAWHAASAALAMAALPILSRYRLTLALSLLALAGAALAYACEGLAARSPRSLMAVAGLALLAAAGQHALGRTLAPEMPRTQEPLLSADVYALRGAHGRAVAELDALLSRLDAAGGAPALRALVAREAARHRVRWAHALLDRGDAAGARVQVGRLEVDYAASGAREGPLLTGILQARLGEREAARRSLNSFLASGGTGEEAREARRWLDRVP